MSRTRTLAALLLVTLAGAACLAADEPKKGEVEVRIRYQIDAFRNERLRQWFPMVKYLESLGLERDEGPDDEPENRAVTRMTGTMPSAGAARKLLSERHVKSLV